MRDEICIKFAKPDVIRSVVRVVLASWLLVSSVACVSPIPSGSIRALPAPPSSSIDSISLIWPANGVMFAKFDNQNNKGIDIAGTMGDPVIAAANGKVVYSGSGLRGYGNLIIIKHDDVFLTAYAHNRTLLVRENENVRAGQKIAEMGNSDADRVKLHFELRRRGTAVDPEPYLPAKGGPQEASPPSQTTVPGTKSNVPRSTGSGFAVTSTLVVTNAHVVQGCTRVVVLDRGTARVRAADGRNDLALLEVSTSSAAATLSQGRLRQGDSITVVGYPLQGLLAKGPQVTAGNVTALAGLADNTALFQISAPVQPGNSGGPVIDSSGNVVGVVVSKLNALKTAAFTGDFPQNVNFAVSSLVLRSFLDAHEVPYRSAPSTKNLATADVADIAKSYTTFIECFQ